jgi:ribose transport system substrate-binding protein
MKIRRFMPVCIAAGLLTLLGCGDGKESRDQTAEGKQSYEIAVIPKGTTSVFWKAVHAGAARAAQETGNRIQWLGSEREDDRKQQIEVVQNFIAGRVDAIVLAPLDEVALVRPVETAMKRGIPVVIMDSGIATEKYHSFVATDNREGGRMAARALGERMRGRGKAILLRYSEGSASTQNREEGFLEVMAGQYPDIQLVSTNQYAGVTKESALIASQNLLTKYGQDIQGVFCPNESSAFGMLRALQISGLTGKIVFIGFDASPGLIQGLKEKSIDGLVVQDPFDIGYQSVIAAVRVLQGEEVPGRLPTRLSLVTLENLNDPEIHAQVFPDLDRWLK